MPRTTPSSARAPDPKHALTRRLKNIKWLWCDVDGVLTDAGVFIGARTELKQFNIQDGLGLVLLRREGIRVGWISSRPSPATTARAAELHVDFLHQGREGKLAAAEQLLAQHGATWKEVCYMGDDLVDLPLLRRAGVAVAVANGVAEARAQAHYVTRARGGQGAVREVAELILKSQGSWARVVAAYAT